MSNFLIGAIMLGVLQSVLTGRIFAYTDKIDDKKSGNKGNAVSEIKDFYSLKAKDIQGKEISFSEYKGKVVLVVNTASKCGFTGQYDGLQKLYSDYKTKGLVIIGFPSNDFGSQEPGTEQEIQNFCKLNYGVDFPMFSKVAVKGDDKSDVYKFLLSNNPKISGEVRWNFEKFLIDKNGKVVDRFRSLTKPASIAKDIEKLL